MQWFNSFWNDKCRSAGSFDSTERSGERQSRRAPHTERTRSFDKDARGHCWVMNQLMPVMEYIKKQTQAFWIKGVDGIEILYRQEMRKNIEEKDRKDKTRWSSSNDSNPSRFSILVIPFPHNHKTRSLWQLFRLWTSERKVNAKWRKREWVSKSQETGQFSWH